MIALSEYAINMQRCDPCRAGAASGQPRSDEPTPSPSPRQLRVILSAGQKHHSLRGRRALEWSRRQISAPRLAPCSSVRKLPSFFVSTFAFKLVHFALLVARLGSDATLRPLPAEFALQTRDEPRCRRFQWRLDNIRLRDANRCRASSSLFNGHTSATRLLMMTLHRAGHFC